MAVELVYQASKGHSSAVRKLLEDGIHPDACNGNGETALFHAVLAEKLGTAKALLKYGADPNRCSENGLSPINAACIQDSVTALALLMNYGGLLDNPGKDTKETAIVSAHRYHSNRVIKYIRKLKKEARLNFRIDEIEDIMDAESFEKKEDKALTKTQQFPGDFSSLPCIDIEDLKTLHEGRKFSFDAPKTTFKAGTWHRVPVIVKRVNNVEYAEKMKREMEILRNVRHPSIVYLLAVITGPIDNQISSIFEDFNMGSLNHLLYHSKENLSLFEKLHLLVDICNAMVYLHAKDIVHCYINSFSVLVKDKCKAKLGNLEHAHKIDEKTDAKETGEVSHLLEQNPWMCAQQLNGNIATKAGDIYSFGALFWECLTRHVPWSWLTNKSIKQVICDDHQELPILQEWPENITEILHRCLGSEEDRPKFVFIREQLDCLKSSGWTIRNDDLDDAFHMWLYGKRKTSFRERTLTGPLASKISWKISGFSIGSEVQDCVSDSKVLVLCSRRKSSIHANAKHRRKTIDAGLAGALNTFQQPGKDSRFNKDKDKYGVEIAEQLSFVRGIWKTAKLHSRSRWAKDAAVRRKLEGDIERLNVHQSSKHAVEQERLSNKKKQGRRIRRLSHGAESIAKLRTIAGKYSKWDWARYTTGHAYTLPEDKYDMLSDEEFDDEDGEQVPIETGGTFVEYHGGKSTEACKIVPSHMHAVGLGKIPESESSEENMDIDPIRDGAVQREFKMAADSVEVVQEHWKKELEDENEQDDTKAKEGFKSRKLNDNNSDDKLKDGNHDCLSGHGKQYKKHDEIDRQEQQSSRGHDGSQHHKQDSPIVDVDRKESDTMDGHPDAPKKGGNDVNLQAGNRHMKACAARECEVEIATEPQKESESVDDGASQFSSEATTFLDEFTDWLDNYYQKNSASSSVSSSLAYREDEATILRNDSRKIFLEELVEKYDSELRKQKSAGVDSSEDGGTVIFRGKSKKISLERLSERCETNFPQDKEWSDKAASSSGNTNHSVSRRDSKRSFAEDLVGIYDAKTRKSHSRTPSNSSCVSYGSLASLSRKESIKSFLEAMVEKYDKQLKKDYADGEMEKDGIERSSKAKP